MKKKYYWILLLLLYASGSMYALPRISYIIPDIGAPDMNTYIEIIASYNAEQNFGTDGFYLNNPGDRVRVRCQNAADTAKITIGPIVVSWNGKMISTQVYVHPYLQPNSSDWSLLDNQYRIPIVVDVDGQTTNANTFYIVRPYNLGINGDVSALADRAFGAGSLGKRSPRGAMIVDSLVLANDDKYHVSVADCDPNTNGNQGYLPFVLISKGKIIGGANTRIMAKGAASDPNRIDAGPGGGGGAGRYCDFKGTALRGGNGFTGGGPGGINGSGLFSNERRDPGSGTGEVSSLTDGNGRIVEGGYSLNGLPGGSSTIAYEAAGGGSGHPFGLSGQGCVDGNNCDPAGGYGAGSGRRQDQNGGGGGNATNGGNTGNNNYGRTVGNIMVIPLAGGSGGACGNPQDPDPISGGCSGEGGGGGGAVFVSAVNINNLAVESNGLSGDDGDGNGAGGGGSGGFAGIQAKLAASNVKLTALGGGRGGGEGRMRYDFMSASNNTTNPATPVSLYKGVTTDTTKWINKTFSLMGGYASGNTIRLFLKPEHGNWIELPEPTYLSGPMYWRADITLSTKDTLFFITAMQSVTNPKQDPVADKYYMEPAFVMSQSAGNILRRNPAPIIAEDDTTIKIKVFSCPGANDADTAWVLNIGNAVLKLVYDNASFTGGGRGFELVAPLLKDVSPKDSIPVVVRFTYSKGQSGIIRDTLIIEHNDTESKRIPWRIFLEAEIIELKIDALTGNGTDTIDFGEVCINAIDTLNFKAVNLSMDKVTFAAPDVKQNTNIFKSWLISGSQANPLDTAYYGVEFAAKEGDFGSWIHVNIDECPEIYDSVYIKGKGVRAEISLKGLANDTIDLGDICLGTTKTYRFRVQNNSIVDANIDFYVPPGHDNVKINLESPNPVAANTERDVIITVDPYFGFYSLNCLVYTRDCGGDTIKLHIRYGGVSGKVQFEPPLVDFGEVKVGNSLTKTAVLRNTGTSPLYFENLLPPDLPFRIVSATPSLPVLLKPKDSIIVEIEYLPNNDNEHRDTVYADGLAIMGACPADSLLPLRGKGIKSIVELNKDLIDFGLIKNCHTKQDSVTISNKGTASVDITTNIITGPGRQYFRFVRSPNLPYSLKAGSQYTYIVEFVPGSSLDGQKTADLEITTDDNSKYIVGLKGSNEGLNVTLPATVNFDAGPIGPDQQKTITLVNDGNFDAHVVKVISTNPKVTVAPQDATIPAKGSFDFTVTMKMDAPGAVNADLMFIFDSHCDDTLTAKVTGMVLDGNLDYSSNLDYGILAPCRDSVMTLEIKNTGQVPIEIRSMQIIGADATLFTFVTPFTPNTIDEGGSYFIEIRFSPAGSTDGIKTAEVEFVAFYNNKETVYKANLTGQRLSGILSVPEPLIFGNIVIGKSSTKTLKITNTGKQAIQLTSLVNKFPAVFNIGSFTPNTNLAPGESTDIAVTFNALSEGCVYDTLVFDFTFAGCDDSKPVPVSGCGINAGSITVILPELREVDPFIDKYSIPLSATLGSEYKESSLMVFSADFTITFNANTFLPLTVSKGKMTTQQPIGGVRTVTISIPDSFIVNKTNTVITELIGSTLLGNTDRTDLTFVNAELMDKSGAPAANVTTQNGSILFRICRSGGDRLLSPAFPLAIQIIPNPASDAVEITVTALEKGLHTAELIDITGAVHKVYSWNAQNNNGNEYDVDMDISGISTGLYYIRVVSPTSTAIETVYIIK